MGRLPTKIPPSVLGKAQAVLSADVLAKLEAQPKTNLPAAMWAELTPEQRSMVAQVRRCLKDGFGAAAPERDRITGDQAPTPYAGTDPTAIASGPDPTTGLDPTSMHEIFGGFVDADGLEKFEGQALLDELRKRFFTHHVVLDYRDARHMMFSQVDNKGGQVQDVYAGRTLENVTGIPADRGPNGFNAEHTWPQGQLKKAGRRDARSDLHHLFPSETFANGKRGSEPFGNVKTVEWENGKSKLGLDENGKRVFQPPENHRGDVARSMFWVSMAYGLKIPDDEEAVLKEWAQFDPVDDRERERNDAIAKVQGDRNPFVLYPELVNRVDDF